MPGASTTGDGGGTEGAGEVLAGGDVVAGGVVADADGLGDPGAGVPPGTGGPVEPHAAAASVTASTSTDITDDRAPIEVSRESRPTSRIGGAEPRHLGTKVAFQAASGREDGTIGPAAWGRFGPVMARARSAIVNTCQ